MIDSFPQETLLSADQTGAASTSDGQVANPKESSGGLQMACNSVSNCRAIDTSAHQHVQAFTLRTYHNLTAAPSKHDKISPPSHHAIADGDTGLNTDSVIFVDVGNGRH